jgi:hypothetical protein
VRRRRHLRSTPGSPRFRGSITPETSENPGGGEGGQVAILLVGLVVVAIALVTVVASAASLHLDRTRLAALADLAALDAADAISDAAYYGGPSAAGGAAPDDEPALTDADVAAAVDAYLRDHPDPAARWDEVRVLEATSPDGRTARVRLAAVVRPAMGSWVLAPFAGGIAIGASSSARAW